MEKGTFEPTLGSSLRAGTRGGSGPGGRAGGFVVSARPWPRCQERPGSPPASWAWGTAAMLSGVVFLVSSL